MSFLTKHPLFSGLNDTRNTLTSFNKRPSYEDFFENWFRCAAVGKCGQTDMDELMTYFFFLQVVFAHEQDYYVKCLFE